jgi:hypothetical protein
LQVLEDHFFYDCRGFTDLAGGFDSGLSAGFAQKASQDAKDTGKKSAYNGKQIQVGAVLDELFFKCHPPPTARPEYKPDS